MSNVVFLNMRALLSYCSNATREVTLLRNKWQDKEELVSEIRKVLKEIHAEIRNGTGDASTLPKRAVLLNQSRDAIHINRGLASEMEAISIAARQIRIQREHYEDLYYEKLRKAQ